MVSLVVKKKYMYRVLRIRENKQLNSTEQMNKVFKVNFQQISSS